MYQLFVFGPERDFHWIMGILIVLIVNGLLIPAPWLVVRYATADRAAAAADNTTTAKVLSVVIDLSIDSVFLYLSLDVVRV